MTQRPPRRPEPPPLPNLSGYRPIDERGGAVPPIEQRFSAPRQTAPVRPPRRQPARRRRRWMRAAAWTIGGLGLVVAAGVGALVVFAPVGLLRDQLIREVQVRTGRDLVIAGKTSISLVPSLGLTMGEVSLSAPPGMGGAPFVKMKQLDVRVALMPLLSRQISVERLVMNEPVFELRVDQKGRRSWDFAELSTRRTVMVAQAGAGQGAGQLPPELQDFLRHSTKGGNGETPAPGAPATSQSTTSRRASVPDVALGEVSIRNGTLRYRDERGGLTEEVRAVNARLSGTSLAAPLAARGDLVLRGDKLDFEGRIGSPRALIEERASRVTLAVTSPRINTRYDGSLTLAKSAQLDGGLRVEGASMRHLAAWLGARLAPGQGLGAFSLEGEIRTGGTSVALDNAKAQIDRISVTGSASVDLAAGRPGLKANLQLGTVDLNPYLAEAGVQPTDTPAQSRGTVDPAAPTPATRPAAGPQVKGFTKRSGWSETPIDLTALGLADADVKLTLAGLVYKDIKIGATQASAVIKGRALRATFDDVRLYNGQGRGVVTLEPTGQGAALGANVTLTGVNGLPLLKDAAGFDWIDGKARVQVAVAGTGPHERGIVEGLNGKAEFGFTDGAIIGFNVPQIIRGLSQGKITGFNRLPTEKTDFSEAGASFVIKNGVAESKDVRASSPLVRLAGAGTVNLAQRQVDAVLKPKLVGSLSGQGGPAGDLTGLELPIKIKGPWERPQVGPDVDGLLKNPNQAVETIREIGKQLQQGKTGGLNSLIEQFRRR
jgi:AsmA protein